MNANNKKKSKLYNSRTIRSQINDPSFDKLDKKLNIPEFLKSRKFEIESFESSQLKSKYASSTRVFQSLPRSLRRRAASHNVKRIPKRMRNKALREMNPSTSTKSNSSKKIPKGRQLYKLNKLKRVLKLASKLKQLKYDVPFDTTINIRKQYKLLNEQLKNIQNEKPQLNNVNGSKDQIGVNNLCAKPTGNIKYSKRQNEFVWLPTHIWHAKRFKMIKKYNYQIPFKPTQKCFKLMNRQNKFKAVCFDTSYHSSMVLDFKSKDNLVTVLNQLLNTTKVPERIKNGERSYNGWLYIKSNPVIKSFIYICNDKILIKVFPSVYIDLFNRLKEIMQPFGDIYDCRYSLGSIDLSGPLSLKYLSKIVYFHSISSEIQQFWSAFSHTKDANLIPIGTTFTFNLKDPRIFRKPSEYPHKSDKDIYDVITELQNSNIADKSKADSLLSSQGRTKSYQDQLSLKQLGKYFATPQKTPSDVSHSEIPVVLSKIDASKWRLVLPWHWVLPFWHQLNRIPQIKPGGLKQIHQFQFECNQPSFPQDFPWLVDGWIHNNLTGDAMQEKDKKLPKSQVGLEKAESINNQIFDAFKCDWNTLKNFIFLRKHFDDDESVYKKAEEFRKEIDNINDPIIEKYNKLNSFHQQFYKNQYQIENVNKVIYMKLPVFQVSLNLIKDGVIEDNARIYSSPGSDIHCIGFVTTGGLNLNLGKFTGLGLIIAQESILDKTVYVRNSGKTTYYPAKFVLI